MTVPVRRLPDDAAAALAALDLAVGAVAVTATAARATARTLRLAPLVEAGARPLVRIGRSWRLRVVREVDHVLPLLVDLALRRYVEAVIDEIDRPSTPPSSRSCSWRRTSAAPGSGSSSTRGTSRSRTRSSSAACSSAPSSSGST